MKWGRERGIGAGSVKSDGPCSKLPLFGNFPIPNRVSPALAFLGRERENSTEPIQTRQDCAREGLVKEGVSRFLPGTRA